MNLLSECAAKRTRELWLGPTGLARRESKPKNEPKDREIPKPIPDTVERAVDWSSALERIVITVSTFKGTLSEDEREELFDRLESIAETVSAEEFAGRLIELSAENPGLILACGKVRMILFDPDYRF